GGELRRGGRVRARVRRREPVGDSAQQYGQSRPSSTDRADKDIRQVSSYKVGVIGGDGIGAEVTAEALKVVRAAGVVLDTTEYDLGADRYVRTGDVLPDAVLEELRRQDAILLGAI